MVVFRIAKKHFITDLTGEGARLYGGRWNNRGTPVLYTSESRSLATVEYLVHLPMSVMARDVCIAEVEIPSSGQIKEIARTELPENWMTYPAPAELAEIGKNWIEERNFLVLKVPSVVVKNEWNYLLNPNHPEYTKVRLLWVEEYTFDQRLFRKGK